MGIQVAHFKQGDCTEWKLWDTAVVLPVVCDAHTKWSDDRLVGASNVLWVLCVGYACSCVVWVRGCTLCWSGVFNRFMGLALHGHGYVFPLPSVWTFLIYFIGGTV